MDTLEDIQRRLRENQYKNEEHVRLSLVARILQEYGWDIWDPTEVNTEFVPVPDEDRKKVDIALFIPLTKPLIFIEVKPVGGITNLGDAERQLRDYNKNITAPFCIITDGREWRFYYSLTPGAFSDKCFRVLNLLNDDTDHIQATFALFLDKNQVQSAEAQNRAKALLSQNEIEKVLTQCCPEARRAVLRPPYPSLPDALKALAEQRGIQVSREDAAAFIEKSEKQEHPTRPGEDTGVETERPPPGVMDCDPNNPPDLSLYGVVEQVYTDCYITCVDDGGGDPAWSDENTQFDRNLLLYPPGGYQRNSGNVEADDWWVAYVLGAFQPYYTEDNDPDTARPDGEGTGEVPTYGKTWPWWPLAHQLSNIFTETIRDACIEKGSQWPPGMQQVIEAETVAHELGHQVLESERHTDHTIMAEELPVPEGEAQFSAQDIADIRGKVSSPGG